MLQKWYCQSAQWTYGELQITNLVRPVFIHMGHGLIQEAEMSTIIKETSQTLWIKLKGFHLS